MRTPARVLFVLKWRDQPYGCDWGDRRGDRPLSSGLFNSARFVVDALDAAGIAAKLVHVVDANAIHREIVAFGATHVVVEAFWVPPYKFDDLRQACPSVEFIVRNHSETPFLAQDGIAFEWTFAYLSKPNVRVAPNSRRMLADTRLLAQGAHANWSDAEVARRVPYLPNIYPEGLARHPRKREDGYLDIGCFGAVRPLKNVATQAIAALMLARRLDLPLNFHINGGRIELGGSPVLKNLEAIFAAEPRAQLMSHGWREHEDFRALVAKMDLVSQVSFSETFNIVCADAASHGVPIVTSPEVTWADPSSRADPTSSASIARAMLRAWSRRHCRQPDTKRLRRFSAESRKIWLATFAGR